MRAGLEPALEERPSLYAVKTSTRVSGTRRDLLRRLDAVHLRHPQVHDHHVRPPAFRQGHGRLAVRCLADHTDVRRAEQR